MHLLNTYLTEGDKDHHCFISKSFVPLRSRIFFHKFLNRQTFDNKTSSVSEIENRAYKHSAGGLRPGDSLDRAHKKIRILGQRRYRSNARKTAKELFPSLRMMSGWSWVFLMVLLLMLRNCYWNSTQPHKNTMSWLLKKVPSTG